MEGATEGAREGATEGARVGEREGGGVAEVVGAGDGGLGGAHCCRMRPKRSICPSLRRRSSFDSASSARRVVVVLVVSLPLRSRMIRRHPMVSLRMILSPLSQRAPGRGGRVMRSAVVFAL